MNKYLPVLCSLALLPACEPTRQSATTAAEKADAVVPTKSEATPTGHVPLLSAEFAKAFFDQKKALFIDVRGREAYNVEHIQGAIDLSLKEIQNGLIPDGPKDQWIITYCACPHSMSSQAAAVLIRKGFKNVYVLDEGFLYWKEKGWPLGGSADPNKPLRMMNIRGRAPGIQAGMAVYAAHTASDQLETGETKADGYFELHLPFYGVADGEPIKLWVGDRVTVVPFSSAGTDVVLLPTAGVKP